MSQLDRKKWRLRSYGGCFQLGWRNNCKREHLCFSCVRLKFQNTLRGGLIGSWTRSFSTRQSKTETTKQKNFMEAQLLSSPTVPLMLCRLHRSKEMPWSGRLFPRHALASSEHSKKIVTCSMYYLRQSFFCRPLLFYFSIRCVVYHYCDWISISVKSVCHFFDSSYLVIFLFILFISLS